MFLLSSNELMAKNLSVFQVLSVRQARVIGNDAFGSNEASVEQVETCLTNFTCVV